MKFTASASILAALILAGCSFPDGGGFLGGSLSSGSTTSTSTRAANYTFDAAIDVDTTAGNGVAALAPSTSGTNNPLLLGHGGNVSELDGTTLTADGALGTPVSRFVRADGGRFFGSTSDAGTPGGGDVYERVGTTWGVSLDTPESELAMASLGQDLYAFSGDRAAGGPGKVNLLAAGGAWAAQTDLPVDCVPSAAASHGGEVWVGAGPPGDTGDAILLRGDASGWTEVTLAAAGAGTDRQHVTAMLSTPDGLAIAIGTFDATGQAVSGELLLYSGSLSSLRSYAGDAPLSLGWQDSLLYVGLDGGALEYRESGSWNTEPGTPSNNGILSLLASDASTLHLGVRVMGGAQLLTRRIDAGGGGGGNPVYADVKPQLMTCATTGCHATTTNFRLSLGLTDDAGDVASIMNYIDTAAPANSVLLTKATATVTHPIQVFAVGSAEYDELLAWITAGAPAN